VLRCRLAYDIHPLPVRVSKYTVDAAFFSVWRWTRHSGLLGFPWIRQPCELFGVAPLRTFVDQLLGACGPSRDPVAFAGLGVWQLTYHYRTSVCIFWLCRRSAVGITPPQPPADSLALTSGFRHPTPLSSGRLSALLPVGVTLRFTLANPRDALFLVFPRFCRRNAPRLLCLACYGLLHGVAGLRSRAFDTRGLCPRAASPFGYTTPSTLPTALGCETSYCAQRTFRNAALVDYPLVFGVGHFCAAPAQDATPAVE